MGNLLRLQLLRDPQVRYAGYRMPHPLVFDCHLKVQTTDSSSTPIQAFRSSIQDLSDETQRIKAKLEEAIEKFESENSNF